MRIALFATCLADSLFPDVAKATVTLLERLGHTVEFPSGQTCCGQMHVNTGYQREAAPLVQHFVETFGSYDVVVAPSGSCTGCVRHQHAMVAERYGPPGLAEQAREVAGRTYELSELLVDVLGVEDVGCCGSATSRSGCCRTSAASSSSSCRTPSSAAGSAGPSRSRTPTPRRR